MSDERTDWQEQFNTSQHFTLLGQSQRSIARAFSYGGSMTVSHLSMEMSESGWREEETHVCLGALSEMRWIQLIAPQSVDEVIVLPGDGYPYQRVQPASAPPTPLPQENQTGGSG